MKRDYVYKKITDRILAEMGKGNIPWKQPWIVKEQRNYFSKKPYNGINVLMTMLENKPSADWATFNQINKHGYKVNKGAKGIPIIFTEMRPIKKENEDGEIEVKFIPFLKGWTIFNISDTNIPIEKSNELANIPDCDDMIKNAIDKLGLAMLTGNSAHYTPSMHSITIPPKSNFKKPEEYYATVFHEIIHATGNATGREFGKSFGDNQYSKEELIAEIGATYLCGNCGIENSVIQNAGAYLKAWKKELENDNRIIVQAASQAQKAVNYLLGKEINNENKKMAKISR